MNEAPIRVRHVGSALVLTVDNPPVNVLSQAVRGALLAALEDAAQRIGRGEADRLVITGAGRAFVAGADAREFDGPALPPHLPEVLDRLVRLPAVAAIQRAALGGGFEIALACRARVLGPHALVGLPEVTLGVVPGAGGTQRLPRLVGLAPALDLIATGRLVKAGEAMALGLADTMADDPVDAACALDPALLARPSLDDAPPPRADPAAVAAARDRAATRQRGQCAPLRAIALVARAADTPLADAMRSERETFLELRQSAPARALRHVFFAERSAGPSAALGTRDTTEIETALVVGGGTMGVGIAYALDRAGIAVTMLEQDGNAASRTRSALARLFDDGVNRGKIARAEADTALDNLPILVGDAPLPPVHLAIEAVFEDLAVKRAVFDRLAAALPRGTILATNTSYLDPNAIAVSLPRPERFLGLHFFAPAHVMKLLEIVRADRTAPETLATAFALAKRLGKIAVEAGICDGFIGNRILTRYRQTGDILLLEGALPWEIDAAMEAFGMAMGPYAVQDLSGLDIAFANRKRKGLRDAPGIRYVPIADRMVEEAGRLGRKSGAGWYAYDAGGARTPDPAVVALIEAASTEAGIERRPFAEETIQRRMMLAMIAETLDILGEGIARRPADVDLVMIHGYGFPRWRGGPSRLAEEWGLATLRAELADYAAADPLSWRVPALLDRLLTTGRSLRDLDKTE